MVLTFDLFTFSRSLVLATANTHSLDDFICMKPGKGPGSVYDLLHFVQQFYKPPDRNITKTQN